MAWLLDTHTLLWAIFSPEKLGPKARAVLESPANEILVGPLCYWEISLKFALGRLDLPGTDPSEIPQAARSLGFHEARLTSETLSTYHRLPKVPGHRDPFGRMLVWHAIRTGHTLLSKDRRLPFYREHGLEFEW